MKPLQSITHTLSITYEEKINLASPCLTWALGDERILHSMLESKLPSVDDQNKIAKASDAS